MEDTTRILQSYSRALATNNKNSWRNRGGVVCKSGWGPVASTNRYVPNLVTRIAFRVTHSPAINERGACADGESRVAIFLYDRTDASGSEYRARRSAITFRNIIAPTDHYPTKSVGTERIDFAFGKEWKEISVWIWSRKMDLSPRHVKISAVESTPEIPTYGTYVEAGWTGARVEEREI